MQQHGRLEGPFEQIESAPSLNWLSFVVIASLLALVAVASAYADPDDSKSVNETQLSPKEQQAWSHNWQLAYRLLDYDRYSWIATDTILAYQDSFDLSVVKGWIVTGEGDSSEVVFGHLSDTGLISPAQISFCKGQSPHPSFRTKCYPVTSSACIGFRALDVFKDKHRKDMNKDNIPYNSYVLFDGDTISVYLFPGATDSYMAFGGGIRGKFLGSQLKKLEDKKLHGSPVLLEPPDNQQPIFRTSSKSDVINEVDIAQFLIQWNRAPEQYIVTPKYIFHLSWDFENNRPLVSTSLGK